MGCVNYDLSSVWRWCRRPKQAFGVVPDRQRPLDPWADACLGHHPFLCGCVVRLGWEKQDTSSPLGPFSFPAPRPPLIPLWWPLQEASSANGGVYPSWVRRSAHMATCPPAHVHAQGRAKARLGFSHRVWFPSRADNIPCGSSVITSCQILPEKSAPGS